MANRYESLFALMSNIETSGVTLFEILIQTLIL